jgi:uncharacterized repeat protein (TIGR01451 family)
VSRSRRLILAAGIAVAIACGARLGQARSDDPPPLVTPQQKSDTERVKTEDAEQPLLLDLDQVAPKAAPKQQSKNRPRSGSSKITTPPPPAVASPARDEDLPENPAALDDGVIRAQGVPSDDGANPLPGAKDSSGQATALDPAAETASGEGYLLSPDRLAPGPQSVGVTVQVLSPPAMNLHKPAKVTIVVKNNGPTDAYGVTVRDQLPEGLKYIGGLPSGRAVDSIVTWYLGTLAAGTDRKLTMEVEPVKIGLCDHAATVSLKTAARAKTLVMQPRLKVEQNVSRSKALKGQQVQFSITVTNSGTGPARDVVVRARLSQGLKHEEGRIVELPFAEVLGKPSLKAHETVVLSPLVVDTTEGGKQTCEVEAISPDVVLEDAEARCVAEVEVTEARLTLALRGSERRFTDTDGVYAITLENPGTAPAENVRVSATLVGDGQPKVPKGAVWNGRARRLEWTIPMIEPQSKPVELGFSVRLGGVQSFQVNAEATAKGLRPVHEACSTDVTGNADVDLIVTEGQRVLDVGQPTVIKIRVKNKGTKEATNLLLRATLSHLEPGRTQGIEQEAGYEAASGTVVFPAIPRLVPGGELTISLEATAKEAGLATCKVSLMHNELEDKIEAMAAARVTGSRSQRR